LLTYDFILLFSISASEMTYIVSSGALNSTHSLLFPYFLVFNHDFIIYINFTHIAASNTATDAVTN